MSVPEWKKAILKKKKEQEEAEKKKQLEKEQYLASLPPWKRAMMKMKEGDGSAATSTAQTKPTTTQTKPATESSVPAKVPAWKQARMRRDSDEKPTTVTTPSTSTTAATQSATTSTTPSSSNKPIEVQKDTAISQKPGQRAGSKISITQTMKGRFEPVEEQAPSPPVFKRLIPLKKVTETSNTLASDKVKVQAKEQKKDEQKGTDSGTLKAVNREEDKKPEDTVKPSDPDTSNKTRRVGQFEQPSKDNTSSPPRRPNRPSLVKAQAMSIDVNDEKFKTLPKWKQELIRRKHQQKEAESGSPLTKTPPKESAPVNQDSSSLVSKNQTSSSPVSKTFPSSPPASPGSNETNQKESSQPQKPEVVNSSENKDQESPKLLRKEGTELRPPVFKVKSKWADIKEDDPDFKNLPEWKRVLILRRKNDVKTRTAPIPKPEKEEKKEPKNDPLPEPLWTPPTRSVPVRETPKEPEKEEVNPLADIRKSLRHVNRPNSATRNDQKTTSTQLQPKVQSVQETERIEAEETVSPLKSETDKPKKKKMRRVSWSDTDLNASLTVEFTYPKYSYEDYHEIQQDEELEGTDGGVADPNELATPLHPSLSPPKNTSNSMSQYNGISSPTHGTGSSSISSEGSSGGGGGSKSFTFGGMPSLGNFMAAYTSGMGGGMGGSLGSFSNGYDNTSSSSSDTTTTPEPKEDEPQNDKEEETVAVVQDENVAALMW